jgi:PIN domain nuclease of toxin-antitoxin system
MNLWKTLKDISNEHSLGYTCILVVNNKIVQTANTLFLNEQNNFYLSIASIWEIAIKVSIGKLDINQPMETFLAEQLQENDVSLLNISFQHTMKVAQLPLHHRDPFDRMIIAQALVEGWPLLSRDEAFDAYGVQRLW